jgi:uncharacterized protein (DUF885 family)
VLDPATIRYSERLTRAYRGLDVLHRAANPDDRWGIVVLDMDETPTATSFKDWTEADAAFERLAAEAADLPEADRRQYYTDLCRSARTVVAWNTKGGEMRLEEQIAGFLATDPRPASVDELEAVRGELAAALADTGYEGELATAAAAWEADVRVAPDDLVATMTALMREASERAAAVFDVQMPPLPAVTLVRGAAFNARCDFANGVVELNTDPTITLGDLRHLVVHEVIPGHCLQFASRAQAYREGWGGADGLLSLVKSAGSPLFEGVADAGNELIGWVEPVDRVTTLVSRLRSGIGTVAAWGLHRDGWSLDRARTYLREHALTGGPGWVENRLGYIVPRGRGAHVWSYWLGERHLRPVYRQRAGRFEPDFLRRVYGRMHSLASLALLVDETTK